MPGPCVLDLDQHASVVGGRANLHFPARRRILDGIVDEVLDDLAQAFAVASHVRQGTVHLGGDAHLVLTKLRGSDDLAQQIREIHVSKTEAERPGLDPRRVEHVADQLCQASCLVAN